MVRVRYRNYVRDRRRSTYDHTGRYRYRNRILEIMALEIEHLRQCRADRMAMQRNCNLEWRSDDRRRLLKRALLFVRSG